MGRGGDAMGDTFYWPDISFNSEALRGFAETMRNIAAGTRDFEDRCILYDAAHIISSLSKRHARNDQARSNGDKPGS